MFMTFSATLVTVQPNHGLICHPTPKDIKSASSVHVLAFSSQGDLLVVESEGHFSIATWEEVYEKASQVCRSQEDEDQGSGDVSMKSDKHEKPKLEAGLREVVRAMTSKERKWKESLS